MLLPVVAAVMFLHRLAPNRICATQVRVSVRHVRIADSSRYHVWGCRDYAHAGYVTKSSCVATYGQ